MPLMPSLVARISHDLPELHFIAAEDFLWSPTDSTVYYRDDADGAEASLLHEVGHALLEHHDYAQDVALVRIEMQAWERARELADRYGITIREDDVQDHLDTYREWLHARSTCPRCEATGYEEKKRIYRCLTCQHTWRVNEARTCGLKRYTLKETP